jgi:hypothetical protein
MFFSEEKNQKTFVFWRPQQDPGHGQPPSMRRKDKSLLLLFFRKEDLPSLPTPAHPVE